MQVKQTDAHTHSPGWYQLETIAFEGKPMQTHREGNVVYTAGAAAAATLGRFSLRLNFCAFHFSYFPICVCVCVRAKRVAFP